MSCFLGLLPSGEALEVLRAHPRPTLDGIRWEPERRWHVTIRYTPHVDATTLQGLVEVADEVAAVLAPARISLEGRTQRLGRDGTLVVPAAGATQLAEAVDDALGGLLGERHEAFFGHLTLARLARSVELPAVLLDVAVTTSFVATELCLIVSTPGRDGSVYDVAHRAGFTGER